LPDRFGISPASHAERDDLVAALRTAIAEELTEQQRQVVTAIVVEGVPLPGGPTGQQPQRHLEDHVRHAP
jgi:hypothetical protein